MTTGQESHVPNDPTIVASDDQQVMQEPAEVASARATNRGPHVPGNPTLDGSDDQQVMQEPEEVFSTFIIGNG